MPQAKCSDQEFIDTFRANGAQRTAEILQIAIRHVHRRRRRLEGKYGEPISSPNNPAPSTHPGRIHKEVEGVVLIGSDAHYWPGLVSTAHRAFLELCDRLQPTMTIMNGDILDGAGISRHPSIGWETKPALVEEIETCKQRLSEIENASPGAERIWTLGNHDARFETRLANVAPEYAMIHGVHLKDHFPAWEPCWSVWLNDDVVVKHRFKGGIHATHNNALWAGKSIVTGHLHSAKVTPFSDYNGTRYGVDTGTMAAPNGPQFNDYLEDNPVNWRQAFGVFTFRDGRLLWPEICHVLDEGEVEFRGEIINV